MSWKPKSSGTSGEIAAMKAMQEAGIPFRWQVGIKTRHSISTYLCDFLVPSENPDKYLALIVEIDGGLHFRTWGGRPALRRMEKDRVKQTNLEAEGYRVLRITDKLVKNQPQEAIRMIKEELTR